MEKLCKRYTKNKQTERAACWAQLELPGLLRAELSSFSEQTPDKSAGLMVGDARGNIWPVSVMYEVPGTILGVSPTVNHPSVTALIFYDLWALCPGWGLSMMGFDLHPSNPNNKRNGASSSSFCHAQSLGGTQRSSKRSKE